MSQARNGTQSLGLAGKNDLSDLAAQEENGDSSFQVTQRLPELLELYARNHFVEGATPAADPTTPPHTGKLAAEFPARQ